MSISIPERFQVDRSREVEGATKALQLDDASHHQLSGLMMVPQVAALGEIHPTVGIDFGQTHRSLGATCEGLTYPEAYRMCGGILKELCSPEQQMHLHCYNGDAAVLGEWLQEFPWTMVGFVAGEWLHTSRASEVLQRMERGRILLESDAPYFPPTEGNSQGTRMGHPRYLARVARMVAQIRGESVREVLRYTSQNARNLYW